jgi:cell division septation protein DedD
VDSSAGTVAKPPAVTSITLTSGREKDVNITQPAGTSGDTPRYLVQVASFSNEKNANSLAETLRARNMPVLMDVVDRTAGRMHRVRVGPYVERAEADAVVSTLGTELKDMDLTPRVLDLRPGDSSPVSTPSDPLVRWVVQVGSFSEAERASNLVAQLRLSGLPAYSEKVTSSAGEVYKVRLGPEISRDKAVELARKVKTDHQLDGFVTTQD